MKTCQQAQQVNQKHPFRHMQLRQKVCSNLVESLICSCTGSIHISASYVQFTNNVVYKVLGGGPLTKEGLQIQVVQHQTSLTTRKLASRQGHIHRGLAK